MLGLALQRMKKGTKTILAKDIAMVMYPPPRVLCEGKGTTPAVRRPM